MLGFLPCATPESPIHGKQPDYSSALTFATGKVELLRRQRQSCPFQAAGKRRRARLTKTPPPTEPSPEGI